MNFKEYYDLNKDPEQLNNAIFSLSTTQKEWYEMKISHLKSCHGKECSLIGNL